MRVDLLPHNQEAYEKVQKAIADGKKKIAISHATGTGKSYLICKLFEDYSDYKKLVLVPSTYISNQIQELFEKYSIGNADVVLYQKLIRMPDEDIAAMDYGVIALDEYHHDVATKVWGKKVKTLIETHLESIFFGTSATPIKTGGVNAIDELFEGNCASDLPLSESIAKKIVPLPKYVGALYTLDDELERLRTRVDKSINTKEERKEFYMKINAMRSQIEKSYGMPIILNKHIKDREGKYIIFCKNKKHLAEIKETVISWFKTAGFKDIHAYEVYSDYENKDAEYKAFCDDTSHSLKLIFCVDMLNEGLHLENISGVLLLRPTGSMLVYLQQIGRAIEANNTNTPVIIDAVNNFASIGQGMKLLKEIKNAIAKEKESDSSFDDSGFEDIDTFFVLEQVLEVQKMFAQIEERLEGSWDLYIKALKQYKEREGDCNVPVRHIEMVNGVSVKLGYWCSNIRRTINGGYNCMLSKEMKKQLDQLGFIWNLYDYKFFLYIRDIKKFVRENKFLPRRTSENIKERSMANFIRRERCLKDKIGVAYPQWKSKKMEEIDGFKWNVVNSYFIDGCKYYKKYTKETGNFTVPKGYKTKDGFNLASWSSLQKNKYRKNKLSEEEMKMLEKIGFIFSLNNDCFDEKFELLREYMKNNNCNSDIPRKTIYKGAKIGRFVISMRSAYKNDSISKYRKEKLESINFIWNAKDKRWNDNLKWIGEYKVKHNGELNISKKDPNVKYYYYWLREQRKLYRNNKMREDRRKLFEQVVMS